MLEQNRLVTLTDAGGCGKTRRALQAAVEVIDKCPDGGGWVELAAVSAPEQVTSAVARVVRLREEDRPLIDTVAEQLAGLDAHDASGSACHSLAYCEQVGRPVTAGLAVAFLAEAQLMAGEYDAAQRRLQAFLARAAATGGAMAVPVAEIVLATIGIARGDAAEARRILEPRVEHLRALGLPLFLSWALSILGAALLAADEHQAAEDALRKANKVGRSIDNEWLVALAAYHLGQLAVSGAEPVEQKIFTTRHLPGGPEGDSTPASRTRWKLSPPSRPSTKASPRRSASSAPPRPCGRCSIWPGGRPTRRTTRIYSPGPATYWMSPPSRPRGPKVKRCPLTKPWPTCRGRGASASVPRRAGPASHPPSSRSSNLLPRD